MAPNLNHRKMQMGQKRLEYFGRYREKKSQVPKGIDFIGRKLVKVTNKILKIEKHAYSVCKKKKEKKM